MTRPSRRLLLLPLLLLVPLGVLKWRADHPPVTQADRLLRSKIGGAYAIAFFGFGARWTEETHLQGRRRVLVRDAAALRALREVLRCSDADVNRGIDPERDSYYISLEVYSPKTRKPRVFNFWRSQNGNALQFFDTAEYREHVSYSVQPSFVPRFEELIASLVASAQAPGSHPQITTTLSAETDLILHP